DLTGAEPSTRGELAHAAADTVKRLVRVPEDEPDWFRTPGLERLRGYLEHKTVWHPMGV
ncbi:MAG: aldehyde dehydrogenase family protein, partial [Thermocrispum sp.]